VLQLSEPSLLIREILFPDWSGSETYVLTTSPCPGLSFSVPYCCVCRDLDLPFPRMNFFTPSPAPMKDSCRNAHERPLVFSLFPNGGEEGLSDQSFDGLYRDDVRALLLPNPHVIPGVEHPPMRERPFHPTKHQNSGSNGFQRRFCQF